MQKNNEIQFSWHPFSSLSAEQIYTILSLRAKVFVVEQACPYLDPDGKDRNAYHLMGMENDELVAYLRLILPTNNDSELIFGRIITAQHTRKKGYGRALMQHMLAHCETHFPHLSIRCSAQVYLKAFYESFGFVAFSDVYLEDDMPHIAMRKVSDAISNA